MFTGQFADRPILTVSQVADWTIRRLVELAQMFGGNFCVNNCSVI